MPGAGGVTGSAAGQVRWAAGGGGAATGGGAAGGSSAAGGATGEPRRTAAGGPGHRPAPAGFPRCGACPYRGLGSPTVCYRCFTASRDQSSHASPAPAGARRCAACGQLVIGARPCPTRWCGCIDRGWSVVHPIGVHAGGLRRAIVNYKYRGQHWWAGVFARLVAGYLDVHAPWFDDFDLVIPVPSYAGAGARRDWDPVGTVAAELAALAGALWVVRGDVLTKRAETPAMTGRGASVRRLLAETDVKRSLRVEDATAVAGARVLVLDDVFAEGSTLRSAALTLRAAGAVEVAGLVLARPPWRKGPATGRAG